MNASPTPPRGLCVVLTRPEALALAAELLASAAALGARAALHIQGAGVAVLAEPTCADLLAHEVQVSVCQTSLAEHRLVFADLPPGIEPAGLVGILATLGDDRLLVL